ncbi:hypothetical protein BH11PAT4_BH11PAT4_7610 [soil metagenome]
MAKRRDPAYKAACREADRLQMEDLEEALAKGEVFPGFWPVMAIACIAICLVGGLSYLLPN